MTTIEPGAYDDRIRFPTPIDVQLPSRALKRFSKELPGFFKALDELRNYARSGKRTPWPSYCYAPNTLSQDILYDHFRLEYNHELATAIVVCEESLATALSAWRLTKGVYCFDPTLLQELANSDINSEVPVDILFRMPEWCVYVPTPGVSFEGMRAHGFFAFLDPEGTEGLGTPELTFCTLYETKNILPGLVAHDPRRLEWLVAQLAAHPDGPIDLVDEYFAVGFSLPLAGDSIANAIAGSAKRAAEAEKRLCAATQSLVDDHGRPVNKSMMEELYDAVLERRARIGTIIQEDTEELARETAWMVNIILYLCSEAADIRPSGVHINRGNLVQRDKDGAQLLPADCIAKWEVGYRIGPQLRLGASPAPSNDVTGIGRQVRPHIRRAHWHTYWVGPLEGHRERRLKWLPPIPVRVDSHDDLVPTVRKVTAATRQDRTGTATRAS